MDIKNDKDFGDAIKIVGAAFAVIIALAVIAIAG